MKKYYSLLLLLLLITTASAQITPTPDTHPKLLKTQGTDPGANVHCGLQDKSGRLWFGTTGDGVYCYDGKSFKNFTQKDGLSDNNVWSIVEDKSGNIWLGTSDGVCLYDGKNFTRIPITVSSLNTLAAASNPSAKIEVWGMLQDKSGQLWFGTTDAVYRYDGKSFTRFLENDGVLNPAGLQLRMANSMLEDKNGNIWFATWFEGVCRYDGKSISNFKPNGEVWYATILEDKAGNIWAGRRGKGVCRYDGQVFTNVAQGGVFDSCAVRPLLQDISDNIWFGSEFSDPARRESLGGLWRYDGKSFKNFTMQDGLAHNSVWSIVEDNSGNLWVGTRKTGLSRFDGETFTTLSE
ncbi:MAG TPA: two-component regulator propeller domain-containing protein [Patescibacteria group bacterium]|nr:two-component regulator propeller domain-containing protein [Patescibacteria group bacterium]